MNYIYSYQNAELVAELIAQSAIKAARHLSHALSKFSIAGFTAIVATRTAHLAHAAAYITVLNACFSVLGHFAEVLLRQSGAFRDASEVKEGATGVTPLTSADKCFMTVVFSLLSQSVEGVALSARPVDHDFLAAPTHPHLESRQTVDCHALIALSTDVQLK